MQEPLVSIVCITYNHEPYLRKALDGFLMQETSFPVEIVLAEDCSTDGTRLICEEYATKYPDRINYIWSETNVGPVANEKRAFAAARGRYIATCEGDDYWTDPLKLQRQVDFLDSHSDYTACFHRYRILQEQGGGWYPDDLAFLFDDNNAAGVNVTTDMFLRRWITQYLTLVFRREAFDLSLIDQYPHYRDSHLFYHLLEKGRGYIFSFDGGVYRQTGSGIYTDLSKLNMQKTQISVFRELWLANSDGRVQVMYNRNIRYYLELLRLQNLRIDYLQYSWLLFCSSWGVKEFLLNVSRYCKMLLK